MDIKTIEYEDMGLVDPVGVIGFPSIGLVSSIAANHYITRLKMRPIAGMAGPSMPPYCLVADTVPLPPLRFYGFKTRRKDGRDAILCMTEYSPKPEEFYDLAHVIMDYLSSKGCKQLVCMEGAPRFTEEAKMMAVASGPNAQNLIRKSKVTGMSTGMVRGLNGVILYDGPENGFDVITLLCPANQGVPDPGSAAEFIDPISRLIPGFRSSPRPLLEEAEQIKKNMAEQEALSKDTAQYYG